MIMIEIAPLENGAHRNQTCDFEMSPPEGWIVVPPHLEGHAKSYLPFIELDIVSGDLAAVRQGEIPPYPPESEPEPQPDYTAFLRGLMDSAPEAETDYERGVAAGRAIAEGQILFQSNILNKSEVNL